MDDGDMEVLKTRLDYLEREIAEIKASIREVNIVTKYVVPLILAVIAVITALR